MMHSQIIDSLVKVLTCPVTQSPITKVCRLKCGHIFDQSSIFNLMIRNHFDCPMCRHPYTPVDVQIDPILQEMVDILRCKNDACTDTSDLCTLIEAPLPSAPVAPPDNDVAADVDDVPDLEDIVPDTDAPSYTSSLRITTSTIPPFRFVDLQDEPINIASQTLQVNRFPTDMAIAERNKEFVKYRLTPIFRYNYQSTLNLQQVKQRLMSDGYMIYDIFLINSTNGLNHYRLYSTDYRLSPFGAILPNNLPISRR